MVPRAYLRFCREPVPLVAIGFWRPCDVTVLPIIRNKVNEHKAIREYVSVLETFQTRNCPAAWGQPQESLVTKLTSIFWALAGGGDMIYPHAGFHDALKILTTRISTTKLLPKTPTTKLP